MSDYISREAAMKAIFDSANSILEFEDPADGSTIVYLMATSNARDAVKAIPAADVRPVVLCRDCKWYKESELLTPNRFCFRLQDGDGNHIGYNFDDLDFCSYGERREDT